MFLRANWKQSFLQASRQMLASVCDGAQQKKVTPLITVLRSIPVSAMGVDYVTLFKNGRIPRIYLSIERDPGMTAEGCISKLKAIFQLTNATFSVISSKPARVLICASYFKETPKPLATAA